MQNNQSNFSINATSTASGYPCTFFGGMQAIASGCATGAISSTPLQGCVTGATQASASHTLGCVSINQAQPGVYPTPRPN